MIETFWFSDKTWWVIETGLEEKKAKMTAWKRVCYSEESPIRLKLTSRMYLRIYNCQCLVRSMESYVWRNHHTWPWSRLTQAGRHLFGVITNGDIEMEILQSEFQRTLHCSIPPSGFSKLYCLVRMISKDIDGRQRWCFWTNCVTMGLANPSPFREILFCLYYGSSLQWATVSFIGDGVFHKRRCSQP